jgi:hypothetical protein
MTVEYRPIEQLPQESMHPFEKSGDVNRTISSIVTSVLLLPIDRMIAKKTVGQEITRETVRDIAKKPFLGAAPRLMNSFLGSCLTFGGSAAFHRELKEKYPATPLFTSALALAGGTVMDKIITAPLGTLVVRMQTQDKTFSTVFREAMGSQKPLRSLYTGTPSLLIRDLLYLPVSIPLAEKLRSSFPKEHSPLADFVKSTTVFALSGTAASTLSYPFQYMGLVQKDFAKPLSMRQVFAKTRRENGFFGLYRGFGMASGRIALYNCLFGGAISICEHLSKCFSHKD